MLCYRLLGEERVTEISDELVPEYVRHELEEEQEELQKREQERVDKALTMTVRVYCKSELKMFDVKRTDLFADFSRRALAEFGYDEEKDGDRVRLRAYSPPLKMMKETYEGRMDKVFNTN